MTERFDVVVVGGGNAGLVAALSARERGASVVVLEKAPLEWAGGNSWFTAGAFRTTYASLDELRPVLDLNDEEAACVELPPYSADAFYDDVQRVTQGRADPVLARILANEAGDAVRWMAGHGVRWELMYGRQSFRSGDRVRFWGNLTLGAVGGGEGLIDAELAAARRNGVEVRFDTPVVGLVERDGRVVGVECREPGGPATVEADAVVLASGGFEADARRRAEYLGPGWDLAKVRGTPYNTGEAMWLAIDRGAATTGHWSGCHAIAWDAAAPETGDRAVSNRYSRQGYPFGIVVNRDGHRFVDEGADFRNYTYAKYGAEIMRQPGALAFQLFDQSTLPYVSAVDYDTATDSRVEAATVAALAGGLGIEPATLERTIAAFNEAVQDGPFDPSIKDGKRTLGVEPPKSNWTMRFETPAFVGFAVTCGVTFTFGGLRIDPEGRVLRDVGRPIPGLFACGEVVGLFYHNYPGGTGLASGAVFGRRAGRSAALDRTTG